MIRGNGRRQRGMIETTRRYFCDACGREIHDYSSSRSIIEIDEDGNPQSIGYDFCMECTLSFRDWIDGRRKAAAGKERENETEGHD